MHSSYHRWLIKAGIVILLALITYAVSYIGIIPHLMVIFEEPPKDDAARAEQTAKALDVLQKIVWLQTGLGAVAIFYSELSVRLETNELVDRVKTLESRIIELESNSKKS